MNCLCFRHMVGVALMAAGLCCELPAQDATNDRDARPDTTLLQDPTRPGQPVRVSTRWIGVVCSPADELLRAHLNLPEGAGLVVHSIVPGSPAEQAGVQQYDILVSVNDTPLTELEQLVEAIEASEGKAIAFAWLRKGESITKEIAPAMRPTEMKWSPDKEGSGWTSDVDADALQQWVEKFKRDPQGNEPFELRFFGPGISPDAAAAEFSGSLTVKVEKEGDKPARITVRRDDESWEVTDETLDQLPEDLQGRVKGMLGKGDGIGIIQLQGDGTTLRLRDLQRLQRMRVPNMVVPPAMQQEFDEMHRRMEDMMRQLQELREQKPESPDDAGVDA